VPIFGIVELRCSEHGNALFLGRYTPTQEAPCGSYSRSRS
jgi:hypothetical protein